ncbi:DNA-methyltransferase [Bradyrhizobium sp. SZCCHNR2023]|uniref:DNA-methyltransferase n=1 Tax=Bradyrhizobium sp. SZCCHNR2023 TaxID=3057380 RepID=UPI0029160191|nr:DNA methyltransferase [Bradyrhizobium sp. SZCCHNR2023]
MTETLLDGKVQLYCGDNRDAIAALPDNSIDSIVTDPPYALVSIVKRFGKQGAAAAKGNDAYARASAGFLGQAWDTGEVAFSVDFWRECLRVLKPGGHLFAFGGDRTYHRLACSIEDAGFEIRRMFLWVYGSGFPKAHDVAKAIDKARDDRADILTVTTFIAAAAERAGMSRADIDAAMGTSDMAGWWTSRLIQRCQCPNLMQWGALKLLLGFGDDMDAAVARLNARKGEPSDTWKDAEVIGEYDRAPTMGFGDHRFDVRDQKIRELSDLAKQWDGWKTDVKPALEPICLGRKPLAGTVAENVLEFGVGALNIDGCRTQADEVIGAARPTVGRFPANFLHDGSAEVLALFPDSVSSGGKQTSSHDGAMRMGRSSGDGANAGGLGDSGSAARFFYTAKADDHDRAGSKHPTVKPVDLMQWLVRLVTPKGGVVLDPFAGTGTTGEAAFREGCRAILMEREPTYQDDIRRRMRLALAGPDERKRESIKAKVEDKAFEPGSLFANL